MTGIMISSRTRSGGSLSAFCKASSALAAVLVAGVFFILLTVSGLRSKIIDSIPASLKIGIAAGIGLFITFIGLQKGKLVLTDLGTGVKMNPQFASPDVIVFLVGVLLTAALHAIAEPEPDPEPVSDPMSEPMSEPASDPMSEPVSEPL